MSRKTYLLVPSFDYPPGSSICLGALLADPLSPHRVLANLAEDQRPEVTTSVQKDRVITRGMGHEAAISTGAQLLQIIGAKVGGDFARDESVEYAMEALRTEFFKSDPDSGAIRELLQAPLVRDAMQSTMWSRPLYMITGLKIAEGFSLSSNSTVKRGGKLGADVPVPAVQGLSVGFETSASKKESRGDSFKIDHEIVLAYRLLRISRKGWKDRKLVFDEYRSKAALLRSGGDDGEWGEDFEVSEASANETSEADEEADSVLGQIQDESADSDGVTYVFEETWNM